MAPARQARKLGERRLGSPGGRERARRQHRVRTGAPSRHARRHRVAGHPGEDVLGQLPQTILVVRAQVAGDDMAHRSHKRPARDVERARSLRSRVQQSFGALLHRIEYDSQLLAHPRATRERLHEHHPSPVWIALHAPQQLPEGRPCGPRPLPLLQGALHTCERLFGHAPVGGQQALFLVGELLIEGGAGDPCACADLRDAERLVTELPGQFDHRLDQTVALSGLGRAPRDRNASPRPGIASHPTRLSCRLRHPLPTIQEACQTTIPICDLRPATFMFEPAALLPAVSQPSLTTGKPANTMNSCATRSFCVRGVDT